MTYLLLLILMAVICVSMVVFDQIIEKKGLRFKFLDRLEFLKLKHMDSILIFAFSFLVYFIFNNHRFIDANNYSYFAHSLLQGRVDIPDMPPYLEQISYNGRIYMHFAPGAVLFVLPFIAIFGMKFNINIISLLLGAFNIMMIYNLLKRAGVESLRSRLWLSALFGFGTVQFYLAVMADSWFLGQIATIFFVLLALLFLYSKNEKKSFQDSLLTGLFFGLAVTCRTSLLFSGIFFVIMLWVKRDEKLKNVLFFCAGALIPIIIYMAYNFVRFNTVIDLGYSLAFKRDWPNDPGGPLQLKFLPYNLYSLFFLSPGFLQGFPYIKPMVDGIAITFTTPFFFYALKAKGEKWAITLLWITVFLTSIPFLLLWGNGKFQLGMRYTFDITPFLMILCAMALPKLDGYKKSVIAYCIFINSWGILYWTFYYLKGIWY